MVFITPPVPAERRSDQNAWVISAEQGWVTFRERHGTVNPEMINQVDRIVLDKTGLTGKFDINLQWTPDVNTAPGNDREVAPDPNGPSLATALSEQLGLRFEATKAPVPILVIDHVERPTAN